MLAKKSLALKLVKNKKNKELKEPQNCKKERNQRVSSIIFWRQKKSIRNDVIGSENKLVKTPHEIKNVMALSKPWAFK